MISHSNNSNKHLLRLELVVTFIVFMWSSFPDADPPRVVLESSDNKSYAIRETAAEAHKSYSPPSLNEDMVIIYLI